MKNFVHNAAHELKTPITGIRAATELLMDEEDDMPKDIKAQFLKNILQDSDRLGRLIHNILDFEKLETGRLNLDMQYQDIQKTITKAISSISQIAAKKEVQIINKNTHTFSTNYDEDRILQVLTNLLVNAGQAVAENGKIAVNSYMNDGFVEVSVSDNGSGIDDEHLSQLFNPFFTTKAEGEGTGLGLSISFNIIKEHGGEILVSSELGVGTCFTIRLPENNACLLDHNTPTSDVRTTLI